MGAAAHTVGPISKMGTLSTSIRALSGREKVRKNQIPRSIPYLPAKTNPDIQDLLSAGPSIIWPLCAILSHIIPQMLQVLPLLCLPWRSWCCYYTEPLHVAVPSMGWHSGWQEKHSASWANSRGSLQWGIKGEGSLPSPDLHDLVSYLTPTKAYAESCLKAFIICHLNSSMAVPQPHPSLTGSPHCTHSESCSGSHRHLLGCSFDRTSTDQGLGPSIPQRSTVGHTLCPLPLERKGWVRRGV